MYNRNDAFVGRGLDLYGEWCDFEIQLMRQFVELGDIVVDAGAISAPRLSHSPIWSGRAVSFMPSSHSVGIS